MAGLSAGFADLLCKEQYQNNFPICNALEFGFARDGKSDFGEFIWVPFLTAH